MSPYLHNQPPATLAAPYRAPAGRARTLVVACLWILLLVALGAGCKRSQANEVHRLPASAATGPKPPAASATPGPSEAAAPLPEGAVRLTGNTEAHRRALISVAGRGIIQRIAVREGDFVKRGQLLAQLDPTEMTLMVRQAEAGLAVAKAQLAAAERERKRLEALAKDKAVAGMQVDQATSAFEAATAGRAAAEAQLAQARRALGDMTIVAPFAGLVGARLKAEGEYVSPMPPSPLYELVEITPLDLNMQAPENLLDRIKVGDEVTAHFNSIGRSATAKVTRLVPIVRPPARTFLVVAEFPNEDLALHPGLFAEVELVPSVRAPREDGGGAVRSRPAAAKTPASPTARPANAPGSEPTR